MLHIKEQLNDLNTQKDTELLDNAYSDILDMLSGNWSQVADWRYILTRLNTANNC